MKEGAFGTLYKAFFYELSKKFLTNTVQMCYWDVQSWITMQRCFHDTSVNLETQNTVIFHPNEVIYDPV